MGNNYSNTASLTSADDGSVPLTFPAQENPGTRYDNLSGPEQIPGTNAAEGGGTFYPPYPYPVEADCDCDPHSGERTTAAPYYFYGFMSEEVLHNYLDKALNVQYISTMCCYYGATGPSYPTDYDPITNPSVLYNTSDTTDVNCTDFSCDHGKLLQMIKDTGAKFVWDLAYFYDGPGGDTPPPGWYLEWVCETLAIDIAFIHAYDNEIICSASLAEKATRHGMLEVPLPPASTGIVDMFFNAASGYPLGRSYGTPYFYYEAMAMDFVSCDAGGDCHLDIRHPETQMHLYYQATRFIDCGCEALIFGDFSEVCYYDHGLILFWSLVSKIRAYGASINPATGLPHARRGVVLINCSVDGSCYHDPDYPAIAPPWQRQLIADFNTAGTYYNRNPAKAGECYDYGYGASSYPVVLNGYRGALNLTAGGYHPQGWYCMHSPGLMFFDNGDNDNDAGCHAALPPPSQDDCYGFDNSSWFARQTEDIRQQILQYTYYKIKCLDPYNHFGMPGRLIVHSMPYSGGTQIYYNAYTEQDTIISLWNGSLAGFYNWINHNFTTGNVLDTDLPPYSSLIFVGDDKMYFIAQDGYIHGYIKVNGDYNDGTWLTVSPSYAADVPAGSQVKAKSDLVASPDGNTLLYIGTDGYIHGFTINTVWAYTYFDFMMSEMSANDSLAQSSLIFPADDKIYYIGTKGAVSIGTMMIYGPSYIHGFVHSVSGWVIADPSYIVTAPQYEAAGALTYDSNTQRLYHTTIYGNLAYYEIVSLFYYNYVVAVPANILLHAAQLTIQGNLAIHYDTATNTTRIYFVGHQFVAGWLHVYCLIENSSGWSMASGMPLTSAAQSDPAGIIAVSPDGSIIAYCGAPYILYFHFDGVYYTYNVIDQPISLPYNFNSLQFTGNGDIYFINTVPFYYLPVYNYVYHLKLQEDYCNNFHIGNYEQP